MLLNAVRGFCMALADSVPGVSGGTIAFLLGFYDEFINSLNDMIGKDNAKQPLFFLLNWELDGSSALVLLLWSFLLCFRHTSMRSVLYSWVLLCLPFPW